MFVRLNDIEPFTPLSPTTVRLQLMIFFIVDEYANYCHVSMLNSSIKCKIVKKKNAIPIFQSPKRHLQSASFLQTNDQNQKTLHLLS